MVNLLDVSFLPVCNYVKKNTENVWPSTLMKWTYKKTLCIFIHISPHVSAAHLGNLLDDTQSSCSLLEVNNLPHIAPSDITFLDTLNRKMEAESWDWWSLRFCGQRLRSSWCVAYSFYFVENVSPVPFLRRIVVAHKWTVALSIRMCTKRKTQTRVAVWTHRRCGWLLRRLVRGPFHTQCISLQSVSSNSRAQCAADVAPIWENTDSHGIIITAKELNV